MYPWAYTGKAPDQKDISHFEDIGRTMARDTGYQFGQIAQVFGIAVGSSADYWYWKKQTLAFGFEISGGEELPTDRQTLDAVSYGNQDAFMHFIEYF
jgi:hypothetical protein